MVLIFFTFFFYTFCPNCIENGWNGIKPLITNKTVAENILGKPVYLEKTKGHGKDLTAYETSEAEVFVKYSTKPCVKSEMEKGNYDVPLDTVLDFFIYPKQPVKLANFAYDSKKYIRIQKEDEDRLSVYENEDDGILFSTQSKDGIEYIYSIEFQPKIKNINYQECKSKINFEIENGWEGIKPFQSTKNEVEKILGKPQEESPYASYYATEEASIDVKYSTEPCQKNENNRGNYNIPKDTVLEISILLNKALKLSELKYNREEFVKDTQYGVFYKNEDESIYFITKHRDSSEYVSSIGFRPSPQNIKNHQCKKSALIENGWKGIKPLVTNKTEAEKILGKPTFVGNPKIHGHDIPTYESSEAEVFINYSTAPCIKSEMERGNYTVPVNTVLNYSVFPKQPIKLSDFQYSSQKFVKSRAESEFTDFHYVDYDDGAMFSTKIKGETEYIYHIEFSPRIKNINFRECKSKIDFEIENGWEGIKPLQTNKTEVEKILGKPQEESPYASYYATEEASIDIKYSADPCHKDENNRGNYNILKDTVLEISVLLNKALKLSDFKYDPSKYEKHLSGLFYKNEEDGISFITKHRDGSEYVSSVVFTPSKTNINKHQCRKGDLIENGWKGIKTLRTDRFSAENILGKSNFLRRMDMSNILYEIYETDEATIQINYKDSLCKETPYTQETNSWENYDVPKDTILKYLVFPKTSIKINDFGFDLEKYRKFENKGEFTDFFYENKDDGITFSTKVKDITKYIYHIEFYPNIKNIGNRNCKTIEELQYPTNKTL